MKRKLPQLMSLSAPQRFAFELSESAEARWNPALQTKDAEDTISMYDPIGANWMGEGVTAKRIAAALRGMGDKNVIVNLNSPGGDVFEGIAIYNLLREHKGEVTVRVLGIAASAASVIAMAGDRIEISRAAFLMVHNVWGGVIGNRHDLRENADVMETIDAALAAVYAVRSGKDVKSIGKLMDKETWFGGNEAIDQGFADALLPADEIEEKDNQGTHNNALRRIDVALARQGMPRAERRTLLAQISGTPGAAGYSVGTPRAADNNTPRAVEGITDLLNQFSERISA